MGGRSSGFGWFLVGFLAGVGATLAAIIFATRPQPSRVAPPTAPQPPAAVVTYHAPKIPEPPPASAADPAPAASPAPASAAPAAPPSAADLQVQQDAAAAGLTSRARH